jgi:hypothetical protein
MLMVLPVAAHVRFNARQKPTHTSKRFNLVPEWILSVRQVTLPPVSQSWYQKLVAMGKRLLPSHEPEKNYTPLFVLGLSTEAEVLQYKLASNGTSSGIRIQITYRSYAGKLQTLSSQTTLLELQQALEKLAQSVGTDHPTLKRWQALLELRPKTA